MLDEQSITTSVCGVAETLRRTGLTPSSFARVRQSPTEGFPRPVPNTFARVLFDVTEIDAWAKAHPTPRRVGRPAEDKAVFDLPRPPIRTPPRR